MSKEVQIEMQQSMEEFFKEAVNTTIDRQRVRADAITVHYLVRMLSEFTSAANLYDEKRGSANTALALIIARAFQASGGERMNLFRRVGDLALYISGFFSDSLNRKIVDIDYYIGVGEGAYSQVSCLVRVARGSDPVEALFDELAKNFPRFVDVLQEVSEQSSLTTNTGTLRLYEKWLRTRSERVERQLRERGVLPTRSARSRYLQ